MHHADLKRDFFMEVFYHLVHLYLKEIVLCQLKLS